MYLMLQLLGCFDGIINDIVMFGWFIFFLFSY